MKSKVVAALAAVVLTMITALVSASPAQAYGWSDSRCDYVTGGRICTTVHTIPSGSGMRVDQTALCAWRDSASSGFRGTHNSTMQFFGSAGAYLGFINLNDTEATVGGKCAYVNSALQMGNGACYHLYGRQDQPFSDPYYNIYGRVLGGAYNC